MKKLAKKAKQRQNNKNAQKRARNEKNISLFGDLTYTNTSDSFDFNINEEDYVEGNYVGRLTNTRYTDGGEDWTEWNSHIEVSKKDLDRGFTVEKDGTKIALNQ